MKKSIIVLTIESTIAPTNAGIIPFISNPGAKNAAIEKVIAFTTIAKSPKVTRVIGRVNNLRIGLMKVLIKPTIIVATKSAVRSSISTPGTIYAVTNNARALPTNDIKYFIRLEL